MRFFLQENFWFCVLSLIYHEEQALVACRNKICTERWIAQLKCNPETFAYTKIICIKIICIHKHWFLVGKRNLSAGYNAGHGNKSLPDVNESTGHCVCRLILIMTRCLDSRWLLKTVFKAATVLMYCYVTTELVNVILHGRRFSCFPFTVFHCDWHLTS